MANAQFGNYRVERQLGPGGAYGVAYLVSDKDNNQAVLKWLKPEAPREGRARFENEVWALKKLAHPYLPKFIDRGEAEGRPYIVMSFAKVRRCGRFLK